MLLPQPLPTVVRPVRELRDDDVDVGAGPRLVAEAEECVALRKHGVVDALPCDEERALREACRNGVDGALRRDRWHELWVRRYVAKAKAPPPPCAL